MNKTRYQLGFSEQHADEMYDEEKRRIKAKKTLSVLNDVLSKEGKNPAALNLLDIGCSTGFMTKFYARQFKKVTGIDIDKDAVLFAGTRNRPINTRYVVSDCLHTGFNPESFDIVTCTQIYEHVPDARQLMREIRRVLKTGGICYFAAGNRLNLVEEHYGLPLLSVMPKMLGHVYLRITGKGKYYYERHLTLMGLRRLVKDFEIIDYTKKIVDEPARYSATDMLTPGTVTHRIARTAIRAAYFLCPTYIWVLRKRNP